MKNAFKVIATIVAVVVIAVGLYLGGWWLTEDSTNRQTVIDRKSTAFNTSRIEKARDDIIEVQSLNDGPQKANIIRGICSAIADINPDTVPSDIAQFTATNC